MKRDMDLIRLILLAAESHEHGFLYDNPPIEGYSAEEIGYHVYLMNQAGLVEAMVENFDQAPSPGALLMCLTWDGHEFLDTARSPTKWEEAKELLHRAGGGSFTIWQNVLTQIIKNGLGVG